MLSEAARFAGALNFTRPYWLTMAGPSGVGKSHLARKIYRQWMIENRFHTVVRDSRVLGNTGSFRDWRKLVAQVRGGDFDLVDDLCEEWFLVLDDIGTEQDNSGFILSVLDRIINARIGKWTVITTNFNVRQVAERLDARIASRMLRGGGVVVEVPENTMDFAMRTRRAA